MPHWIYRISRLLLQAAQRQADMDECFRRMSERKRNSPSDRVVIRKRFFQAGALEGPERFHLAGL